MRPLLVPQDDARDGGSASRHVPPRIARGRTRPPARGRAAAGDRDRAAVWRGQIRGHGGPVRRLRRRQRASAWRHLRAMGWHRMARAARLVPEPRLCAGRQLSRRVRELGGCRGLRGLAGGADRGGASACSPRRSGSTPHAPAPRRPIGGAPRSPRPGQRQARHGGRGRRDMAAADTAGCELRIPGGSIRCTATSGNGCRTPWHPSHAGAAPDGSARQGPPDSKRACAEAVGSTARRAQIGPSPRRRPSAAPSDIGFRIAEDIETICQPTLDRGIKHGGCG